MVSSYNVEASSLRSSRIHVNFICKLANCVKKCPLRPARLHQTSSHLASFQVVCHTPTLHQLATQQPITPPCARGHGKPPIFSYKSFLSQWTKGGWKKVRKKGEKAFFSANKGRRKGGLGLFCFGSTKCERGTFWKRESGRGEATRELTVMLFTFFCYLLFL